MRWWGMPLQGAMVAAPMWKLWLEKFTCNSCSWHYLPEPVGEKKILEWTAVLQEKQWTRAITPDGQIPHCGLHRAEMVVHCPHCGYLQPCRRGLNEALILTRMHECEDGQSTATCWMVMCSAMEKLLNCKLQSSKKTKLTKGVRCPECRLIRNIQVQRFPNNHHQVISVG